EGALEIDDSVAPLVAAAAVPHGESAALVPAALLAEGDCQRLLRLLLGDLGEGVAAGVAATRRGWLVDAYWHVPSPRLDAFEHFDALAGRERNDRLLPGGCHSRGLAHAP